MWNNLGEDTPLPYLMLSFILMWTFCQHDSEIQQKAVVIKPDCLDSKGA